MAKKTTFIHVRGVLPTDKKSLQKIAKDNRLSLNSIMLHSIDFYLNKFPRPEGVPLHSWNKKEKYEGIPIENL